MRHLFLIFQVTKRKTNHLLKVVVLKVGAAESWCAIDVYLLSASKRFSDCFEKSRIDTESKGVEGEKKL